MKFLIGIILFSLSSFITHPIMANTINLFFNEGIFQCPRFWEWYPSQSSPLNVEYAPSVLIPFFWNKNIFPSDTQTTNSPLIQFFNLRDTSINSNSTLSWKQDLFQSWTDSLTLFNKGNSQIMQIDPVILNKEEYSLQNIGDRIKNNSSVGSNDLNYTVDISSFCSSPSNNFKKELSAIEGKTSLYIYSDKEKLTGINQGTNYDYYFYSLQSNQNLSLADTQIFQLSTLLYYSHIFNSFDDIQLGLLPVIFKKPKRSYKTSLIYHLSDQSYMCLFDKENYIVFDLSSGNLKKWFLYPQGECLINFDSFSEKIYSKSEDQFQVLEKLNVTLSKFDNGFSCTEDFSNDVRVIKNIVFQYGRLILSYNVQNLVKKRKQIILEIENKFSPSFYFDLLHSDHRWGFYNTTTKKISDKLTLKNNAWLNLNTGYGIAWTSYHGASGVEFFKGSYFLGQKKYYKITLYPLEKKIITASYRKMSVPKSRINRFINKIEKLTNQSYGDCLIK